MSSVRVRSAPLNLSPAETGVSVAGRRSAVRRFPPGPAYSTLLSSFSGQIYKAHGPWYVQDFVGRDFGCIGEGWGLEVTYDPTGAVPEPLSVVVWSLLGAATVGILKLRNWNRSEST